jgi:hypothetical protein
MAIRRSRDARPERHLPGLAVGVVQGDDLTFTEGSSFADIENGRKREPVHSWRK